MSEKDRYDLILHLGTLVGAVVGFLVALHQWRKGQAWLRAERLDKFIQEFRTDELLSLAATAVDWTRRRLRFRAQEFLLTNTDALQALRFHGDMENGGRFDGNQDALRDAYDALLAFFLRLEVAISSGLIDSAPAKAYFRYWLERLIKFDMHPDDNHLLGDKTPTQAVQRYIEKYAQPDSVARLCKSFDVSFST